MPARCKWLGWREVQEVIDERTKARFIAKVDMRGDCWVWTATRMSRGYGYFYANGKMRGAHRVAWAIAHGYFPDVHVLHRCDNPPCVRPDHLFLGTQRDNMADMAAKGRCGRGDITGVNHP